MSRRTGVALAVSALLLSGCATDLRGELRRDVANITDDANDRDAAAVRSGVEDLLETLQDAVDAGELSSAEAARITELARQLSEQAGLLEPEVVEEPTDGPTEEPDDEPTDEPVEEPSPSPSPTPSRTPSPAPSPEPTGEPEPTDEPSATLLPDVVPSG